MSSVLVLCEGASGNPDNYDKTITLTHSHLRTSNILFKIDEYYNSLAGKLDDIYLDLLRIATYVYVADTSVRRGGEADIWGKKWRRHFSFVIPVLMPELWNSPDINTSLKETLHFLTDDNYEFNFIQWKNPEKQEFLNLFKTANDGIGADCVVLFSGGLDSLYAAGKLSIIEGRKPLLISHASVNKLASRQREVVHSLREHITNWTFPHWIVRISRHGREGPERTQRSRSFLFLALGITAASGLNVKEVFLCDNGIVSINLPPSSQTIGAMASRTTHPRFIKNMNKLLQHLHKCGFKDMVVKNQLLNLTKAEVVKGLKEIKLESLIPLTVSCVRTHGMSKMRPHCGVCTQCIDRRFATVYADLEFEDLPESYEKDIFKDDIEDKTHIENLVRFCTMLSELSLEGFVEKFPMVWDCIDEEDDPDEIIPVIYALYQRYSNQIIETLRKKQNNLFKEYVTGKISKNSVLGIIGRHEHLLDPVEKVANEIGELLRKRLPIVFQDQKPTKEKQIQDAAQALLSEFNDRIARESPQISFGIVNRRPDFSKDDRMLFIELKLVKSKKDINKVIDQILADISPYLSYSRCVLFCIYDTDRYISDDEEFIKPIINNNRNKVFVKIIR